MRGGVGPRAAGAVVEGGGGGGGTAPGAPDEMDVDAVYRRKRLCGSLISLSLAKSVSRLGWLLNLLSGRFDSAPQ